MASYKIDFVSLKGTQYQVQIDEGKWDAENAVALIGSDNPFETQEDDSTDADCWLRETTGYFRVIDKGDGTFPKFFNTSNDHWRVRLYDATNAKYQFCGYIKQEEYNQDLFTYPVKVEIPIISRLTMMKDKLLSSESREVLYPDSIEEIVVVGDFLATVMGDMYDTIYLPNNELGQSVTKTWTDDEGNQKMVGEVKWYLYNYKTPIDVQLSFWINAFKELIAIEDSDKRACYGGGKWKPCTYGDVLESICACFGWYMFEDGDHIICRDINPSALIGYRIITKFSLTNKEANTDWSTRGKASSTISQTEISANDLNYCNDDHEHEIVAPNSLVSLKSEAQAQTNTLFSLSKGEEIIHGGHFVAYSSRAQAVDIPFNCDVDEIISQTRLKMNGDPGDAYLLDHPNDECGGELIAWGDNKAILLSRYSKTENRAAVSLEGYGEALYPPIDNGQKTQHAYINIKGTLKGGDGRYPGEYSTVEATIKAYVSIQGTINLIQSITSGSDGKFSIDMPFKIYWSNVTDVNPPTFAPGRSFGEAYTGCGKISILLYTCTSHKFVTITDFEVKMKNYKGTGSVWVSEKDWEKIELQRIYGMVDASEEVKATTKFGMMETNGALMDGKRVILKAPNSQSSTGYLYKVFYNYPATYIGTLADGTGAEALIRRTFKHLGNGNSLDKMAVYVNDSIKIHNRIKYGDTKYLPIAREWNYRDDECKLTLLQTTATDKPVPENAVVISFSKEFRSGATVDTVSLEKAIDCDVTIVYHWVKESDKSTVSVKMTFHVGKTTTFSNGHAQATANFTEDDIDSITFSDESYGYKAVINII